MALPIWDRGIWVVAGAAVGGAAADAIAPILEPARQNAWARRPFKVLAPGVLAQLAAREQVDGYGGIPLRGVSLLDDAHRNGLGAARLELETALAREWPDLSALLRLRRRGVVGPAGSGIEQGDFRDGLRRQGYTTATIDDLTKLLTARLAPADVANAVQQGFLPNTSSLHPSDPLLPPAAAGDAPFTPPVELVDLDPEQQAFENGVTWEQLKVLAQLSGNPPGPETLLELWRRGFITETAVEHGIREGRTKTKWTPALKLLVNQLLPPSVLVNRRLRGWDEPDTFHARMKLHGYNAAQSEDWYESSGRPAAPVQMFDAWARGAPGPFGGTFDKQDFLTGIRRSDIRPEYGETLWALRWHYPSLFQLRRAVSDGSITPARAREILHIERYEKEDIDGLLRSWTSTSTGEQAGNTKAEIVREYESRIIDLARATALL